MVAVFAHSSDGSSISKLDFSLLTDTQLCNRQLQLLRSMEIRLHDVVLPDGKMLLYVSTSHPQLLVPQDLSHEVSQSLHSL